MAEVTLVLCAPDGTEVRKQKVALVDGRLHLPFVRNEFKLCCIKLGVVGIPDILEYSPATYAAGEEIEVSGIPLATGNFNLSQEPFIKVETDSGYRHPFMPVTLRHIWEQSITMSAEVMLDTGDAATGIYLPQRQVQKLQLRSLMVTKEVEGWGGGTTTLLQYEPIWVEVNLTNPATGAQKQRKALLNVWSVEPSASAAVEAPGSTPASSAPQPASTPQPASAPQQSSTSAVCKPKVEMRHLPQPAGSASQHEPGTPTKPPDAASSQPTADEFELSPLKRPARPGDEFAILSFQGMQALELRWDIKQSRIYTRFFPIQIL